MRVNQQRLVSPEVQPVNLIMMERNPWIEPNAVMRNLVFHAYLAKALSETSANDHESSLVSSYGIDHGGFHGAGSRSSKEDRAGSGLCIGQRQHHSFARQNNL